MRTGSRSFMRDPSFAQALHAHASGSLSCLADTRAQNAVAECFFGRVTSWMPVFGDEFQGWRSTRPTRRTRRTKMDQAMLSVVRAVEAGATTMKGVIDATGLSRLKIERALNVLKKQKLLVRL